MTVPTPLPGGTSTLVLGKIVSILDCFHLTAPELTLPQLIRATGIPSSTCQRLVNDLVAERILDREDNRYRIGITLVRWAAPGTLGLDVVRSAQPVLNMLRDETGETACLYVRDGLRRTVVAVAETRHVVIRPFAVGMIMPIHAGAPGKVFLAFDPAAMSELEKTGELETYTARTPTSFGELHQQLHTVRHQGYATAFDERHEGVGSISAPVFGPVQDLRAVIGLGFPTSRVGAVQAERWSPAILEAATKVSRNLGFTGHFPKPA